MMDTVHARLHRVLVTHLDTLAAHWHAALVQASPSTLPDPSLRASITALTERMVDLLIADAHDAAAARAVGAALASLPVPRVMALSRTHAVWVEAVMAAGAEAERQVVPRLMTVLGDLADGFVAQVEADTRQEAQHERVIYQDDPEPVAARHHVEAWLRMLVANVPLILVAIDSGGTIQLVEGPGLDALGFSSATMVGRPVAAICALLAPDEEDEVLRNWERALAGDTFSATGTARRIAFETHYAPLHDQDGTRVGAVAVALDITERIRMTTELARMHQQIAAQTEAERVHLARELHDDALQTLHGIGYQLELLGKQMEQGRLDEREAVEVAVGVERARLEVLDVARHLRALVSDLRPPMLEAFGLDAALSAHVERLRHEVTAKGLTVEAALDTADAVLPELFALSLYRIAQEAMRNALRHSGATHLWVRLWGESSAIVLVVEDDGQGFVLPSDLGHLAWDNHYGLVGMAERVAWIGGTLTIRTEPGAGCTVEVRAPVPVLDKEQVDG